jgi:hypothetical protein
MDRPVAAPGWATVSLDVVAHAASLEAESAPWAPAVAVQFLDYPLLTLAPRQAGGAAEADGSIALECGKSCSFTADLEETRALLQQVGRAAARCPRCPLPPLPAARCPRSQLPSALAAA